MSIVKAKSTRDLRSTVARAPQRSAQAEADYRSGLAWAERENWPAAERAFWAAVQRKPDDSVFWLNLAHARVKRGALDAAAEAARRAVEIDPRSELGIAIASQCLAAGNRHTETVDLLRSVDLERASKPNVHLALGNALMALGRYREAVDAFLASLARKPDFMPAHVQLANAFERMALHVEARECLHTALALGGDAVTMRSGMAYHAQHACRWDLFEKDLADLQIDLAAGTGQPVPFHLLTMPSTRQQQHAAGRAYWAERCAAIEAMPRPAQRAGRTRLRVGYVTNDIFRHATAYLIADLLETHDRDRVDVFLYSYSDDDGSPIRRRIIAATGAGFVEAGGMSDQEVAQRVRADDIDVLVDLKGYTLGTRLGICAYRPARVQVNYLGYPGTMGAPGYDYLIGDRVVTPLEHAADYSECIAQMPHCYQPNDRLRPVGVRPTRAACGLPEQGFVFCSFNNCYKITAPVFDRWCRLLRQVEGSVLWLYEANAQARPNLLREAEARGIGPERLVWAPHRDLAEHLGRLQLADLVLDTLPVNAHTTASDALWTGVPMITVPGASFVSRVAASILEAAGMGELVARDLDHYEALALELARSPARLAALRARLAGAREHCALFDGAAHTRALEALYARMMERWDAGAAPGHLAAAGT